MTSQIATVPARSANRASAASAWAAVSNGLQPSGRAAATGSTDRREVRAVFQDAAATFEPLDLASDAGQLALQYQHLVHLGRLLH